MKKIVMIIAPENFRDEEFLHPKEVFESNNIEITVASKGVEIAKGKLGLKQKVDIDLSEINVNDFDAVVFVGGGGSKIYAEDKTALSIARSTVEKGKILAAICAAPKILASAGLLEGKTATAHESEKESLINAGANYTGEQVSVDGNIITGNGPAAAKAFGEKIVELLQ